MTEPTRTIPICGSIARRCPACEHPALLSVTRKPDFYCNQP